MGVPAFPDRNDLPVIDQNEFELVRQIDHAAQAQPCAGRAKVADRAGQRAAPLVEDYDSRFELPCAPAAALLGGGDRAGFRRPSCFPSVRHVLPRLAKLSGLKLYKRLTSSKLRCFGIRA
jgi:hypothetical protein